MDERRIHRYLDGELSLRDLTPEEQSQLEAYEAIIRHGNHAWEGRKVSGRNGGGHGSHRGPRAGSASHRHPCAGGRELACSLAVASPSRSPETRLRVRGSCSFSPVVASYTDG